MKLLEIAKIAALGSMILASTPSVAEERMTPGLWEMRVRSDAFKGVQNMPPAQLEELKKRGIQMPDIKDGMMAQKVCISKEMAESAGRSHLPGNPNGCKETKTLRQGNAYFMEMVCNGPTLKGSGTVKASYDSKSMHSVFDFKSSASRGPKTQHIETMGKWLNHDCGNVKASPLPQTIKKPKEN